MASNSVTFTDDVLMVILASMIRRVRKTYPTLQPMHSLFSKSLLYSLLVCLVAVVLPLYESANPWTLALFILTAAVALPHVLPKLKMAPTTKHPHRSYDRLLQATVLGCLGLITYALYFVTRSISVVGVDASSQEHAGATTGAYLVIFLGCAVSFYFVTKRTKRTLFTVLVGLLVFSALAYSTLGQELGFGGLGFGDLLNILSVTVLYSCIVYFVYHGRHHTRHKLFTDHDVNTLSKHISKR